MLAYTILLIACALAVSSASKATGGFVVRGHGAVHPRPHLLTRHVVKHTGIVRPAVAIGGIGSHKVIPSSKHATHGTGVHTYHSAGVNGIVGNVGVGSVLASPGVVQQQIFASGPYQANTGVSTYDISVGNTGTVYSDPGASLALLNTPVSGLSFNAPTSKKAAIGSY